MRVFICWSGERSKEIAKAFRDWLKPCLQAVDPWMSETDIEKGKQFTQELSTQLSNANFGLVCLTSENVNAPWINFESGALSKLDKSYLWTFLYDLEQNQIEGPLASFQHTKNSKEDIGNLLSVMNSVAGTKLEKQQLEQVFNALWPDLEKRLKAIPASSSTPLSKRKVPDMIEEILERVRDLQDRQLPQKQTIEWLGTGKPAYGEGKSRAAILAELLRGEVRWKADEASSIPSLLKSPEKNED